MLCACRRSPRLAQHLSIAARVQPLPISPGSPRGTNDVLGTRYYIRRLLAVFDIYPRWVRAIQADVD